MSLKAQPLRTALIGLSSSAVTSWASSAHLPGLLCSSGRSRYAITALLNSSAEAAKSAIQLYGLPATTKSYGSPQDLADDKDVDIVICNTRVDKHYETILPSLQAGKDVYVEWPIAANMDDIHELVRTAKESGSRVAVGLQRRWTPSVVKLRSIVQEGKLGKILSANVQAFGGTVDREILPIGLKYFAERNVGGNPITIGFGHLFDLVLSVTGELEPASVDAKLQLQRPDIRIRNPSTGDIISQTISSVPDLLSLHGSLQDSPYTTPSATLSIFYRRGQPFPNTPTLTITINFERGEVRLVSPSSLSLLPATPDEPVTIQVHHFESNEVENVKWEWSDINEEVPPGARDVQNCLYAFADGDEGWVSLEDAARRATMIESFLSGWEQRTNS